MSINKDWTVCDLTGIIVNDGVTIMPGYVEIKHGYKYTHTSDDPMNELAKFKPFILHNRVKYIEVKKEKCTDKRLQGKHFIREEAIADYLLTDKNK